MENYKKLFEQIKQFKKEQEKQKQRGLNNYNILTTVLKQHDEVRLHSRMIASFLDPSGRHYQSTLFLDKFLEVLNISDFKINSENCYVYLEYKNIDLYITDGDKHIIIENKIYAKDQENQIKRYIDIIKDENQDLKYNDILVIYLSLGRGIPKQYSLGDLALENSILTRDTKNIALLKSIHYKNEILDWLEKCKYKVQNITNLNEVFRQYIDVVKMINNQYEDKIMSLSDYIKDNKEIYKLAIEIEKELPKVRKSIIDKFFRNIIFELEKELGDEWKIELVGNLNESHDGNLHIYYKTWIKEMNLIFAFEFDSDDYIDGYFGIARVNSDINIQNIVNKFSSKLKKLNYKIKTTKWWLHWEWLPSQINNDIDFVEYIQSNKNAEENIINGIMKLIKIFEEDSNLMTEINNYLNEKDKN